MYIIPMRLSRVILKESLCTRVHNHPMARARAQWQFSCHREGRSAPQDSCHRPPQESCQRGEKTGFFKKSLKSTKLDLGRGCPVPHDLSFQVLGVVPKLRCGTHDPRANGGGEGNPKGGPRRGSTETPVVRLARVLRGPFDPGLRLLP